MTLERFKTFPWHIKNIHPGNNIPPKTWRLCSTDNQKGVCLNKMEDGGGGVWLRAERSALTASKQKLSKLEQRPGFQMSRWWIRLSGSISAAGRTEKPHSAVINHRPPRHATMQPPQSPHTKKKEEENYYPSAQRQRDGIFLYMRRWPVGSEWKKRRRMINWRRREVFVSFKCLEIKIILF